MFGFGNKNTFLGIDIGTSSIKILEIKIKDKRPVLSNYAWMKVGGSEGDVMTASLDGTLPGYLKKLIKEANFASKASFVSIPSFNGLISLIEFPEMEEKDIAQAIRFEAHKYIPTPLEDISFSWERVGKKAGNKEASGGVQGGTIQLLLAAAPKNKIKKYESLAKQAGLDLRGIEIESFSLTRSLVGQDKGKFIIADIGSRVCNIILLEEGIIKVNRNMDAGGRDITKAISKSMGIEEARAEQIKTSGKNFFENGSGMFFPVLDLIAGEIKRVLAAYYKNENNPKADAVILSGGTAKFPGIEKYFSDSLGIKTIIGNPLSRIDYDKKLEPIIGQINTQFSVCAGLALKGAEEQFNK